MSPADEHYRRETDADEKRALRALVVDDDDNYRTFVAALLRRTGIESDTATDGAAALEILQGGRSYDLLLIDCDMPRLDGLQLIARIRGDEKLSSGYAVMLTGRCDVETKIAALTAGYDDFLVKASTELELIAKIVASQRLAVRKRSADATLRELRGLACTDELTGLHNRRFFFEEAETALNGAEHLTLILFDLDNFKQVNDTFGHLAGDLVLRDVAATFKRQTRYEDVVVRYGGDEFIMLVHELSLVQVDQIVARITAQVEALRWTFGAQSLQVGLTAGVATTQLLMTRDIRTLMDASDRDLYKNKFVKKSPDKCSAELYRYGRSQDGEIVDFPASTDAGQQSSSREK